MDFRIEEYEDNYYSYYYNNGWELLGISCCELHAIMRIKKFAKLNNIKNIKIIIHY